MNKYDWKNAFPKPSENFHNKLCMTLDSFEKENVKMKIKIFSKKDTLELEKEVNSFMEERVVMDVKYQSMYVATKYNGDGIPIEGKIIDRAMVIYAD